MRSFFFQYGVSCSLLMVLQLVSFSPGKLAFASIITEYQPANILILNEINIDETDSLLAALDHEELDVRVAAAQVLGRYGFREAMPKILAMFEEKIDTVHKIRVAHALALLKDPDGVEYLKQMCDQKEDKWKRARSANYLADADDSYGYSAVVEILETANIEDTNDRSVFIYALQLLSRFKKFEGLKIKKYMLQALEHSDPDIRGRAIDEFLDLMDIADVAILKDALEKEKDPRVKKSLEFAIRCLIQGGCLRGI